MLWLYMGTRYVKPEYVVRGVNLVFGHGDAYMAQTQLPSTRDIKQWVEPMQLAVFSNES